MKLLLAVFLAIVCLSQVSLTQDTTYCEVNHQYINTKLFTSVQEKQYHYLDKYINGYNLSFEFAFADLSEDHPALNNYKIFQGISEEQDKLSHDDFKIFIAQDDILKNSGETSFVALAESLEGRYVAKFGIGDKDTTPYYIKTIQLPENSKVTCFDITMVTEDVAVVDCMENHSGQLLHPYMNVFYIVSLHGDHAEEYQRIANNWNYVNPFGRKNRLYDTSHDGISQKFIIQGIPFDLDEGDVTESYLNIYRYVTDDPDNFHNGHMQVNSPITADTLGMPGQFLLADFDVLGDFIYVLDHKSGVYFFQYKGNKIHNLKRHLGDSANFANRWGISVNYDGSIVQMLIAESAQIVQYHMYHIDDGPQHSENYRIENQLIGTVELQSNAEYVALRQGRLLSIYEKGQTNMDLLKGVIENVESFTLFYSNNIMTYDSNEVSSYMVQKPTLRISPHDEENEFNIIIFATSKNFATTEKCSIQLVNHIVGDAASKAFYDANYPTEIDWTDSQSGFTSIPLEKHFVGPNLTYDVQVLPDDIPKQQQKGFLGERNSDEDSNVLLYNEPREVFFTFGIDGDLEHVWQWTSVVPFLDGSEKFYTIHQNTQNNVLIYRCKPSLFTFNGVDCQEHVSEIPFNAPVKTQTYGTWGNQLETFAAVDSFIPSVVNFYHLIAEPDVEPGDFFTSIDYNDVEEWGYGNKVIDMVLNNNTLYAVIEGKSERFVTISSNVVDLQHRARVTELDIYEWRQDVLHTWYPEQVTVSSSHKNVLFIKSRSMIYIISVENHDPQFLNVVMLFKDIGTYVYAGPHSLVVAESDTKIYDYSLINLNNVASDVEFTYQTYEYQFIDPFTITSNHYSGLIYVLAHTYNKSDLQLLIYRSGVENIRTLYKVIELESQINIDQQQLINIAVGGIDEDYVFIQYNGKKKYVRSPGEPSIILIPFLNAKNEYVDFVPIGVQVHGWDGKQISTERDITVVNSQTQIHLDVMKINAQFKDPLYANDKPHAEFKLDTKDWYEGSVLGFDIECSPNPEACGKEITLQSMLHDKPGYKSSTYKDVTDLLNIYDHILMLTKDPVDNNIFIIYKLSNDLDFSNKVIYGKIDSQKEQYECTFMTPSYDDKGGYHYLITLCYDVKLQTWATFRTFGSLQSTTDNYNALNDDEEFRYLPGIKDIKRKQYQFFHDQLYINYEADNAYAGIYIFDLNKSETLTIDQKSVVANVETRVVNSSSFMGQAPNLRITSFYVDYEELDHILAREDQVYVKLIITDSPEGDSYAPYLRFISLKIADNYAPDYSDSDELDVRKFIQDQKLFVNNQTHLLKIQIMDIHEEHDPVDRIDIVKYHGFLLTDNTAMYKLELVFTRSSSDTEKPLVFSQQRTKIVEIFNNYGTNVAYPQIELYQHCIGIAYFNPFTKNVTLTIYEYIQLYQGKYGRFSRVNRNEISRTSQKNSGGLPLYTFKAGVKLNSVFGSIGLQFPPVSYILYGGSNGIGLLSEDMSYTDNLLAMDFKADQMTLITDGDFSKQTVTFKARSDFINKDTPQFAAKVDPHSFVPEDDDKKGGGLSAGIIVLIVILVLAFVAGVGFFVYKKYFQGNSGSAAVPLMKPSGDNVSDMGFSMQEATKA